MKIKTFAPKDLPSNVDYLAPQQTHSANLIEIKTGRENLANCDGLWSRNFKFCLGVQTADCAPISFYNAQSFGIIHAGWRGCVNGLIENLIAVVESQGPLNETTFHIGPILPQFEIKKDDCYEQIHKKFGEAHFIKANGLIVFDFKNCLKSLIPSAEFDPRSTAEIDQLASWRRDQNQARNLTLINRPGNSV